MIDSTNPRILADNIRALFKRPVGTQVEGNPSGSGYSNLLTKIKIGSTKYKIVSWKDVTGTLTAGETSLVLEDTAIKTDSTFEIYTDTYGINPSSVTVTNGSITLVFASQASDLGVKVRIS